MDRPILAIVIPCYNEEAVLPKTVPLFAAKIVALISAGRIDERSFVLLSNDGSRDDTWNQIAHFASRDPQHIRGISLSRNRGHQNALLAGLMEVKDVADVAVSADCDGQDDIDAIDRMLDEYEKGAEVVYACRDNRETDTWFKRTTAEFFYRLINWMGGEVVFNHADYRLATAAVLQGLSEFREVNLFLRGMFPLVGFKAARVYYRRQERLAGGTHYPFLKMLSFAIDGITSLSVKPIRLITLFGGLVSFVAFLMIVWSLVSYFCGRSVPGWTSSVLCVCLFGGIQLLSLGVIGEYVGKIYLEAKHRPRFIIRDRTHKRRRGCYVRIVGL